MDSIEKKICEAIDIIVNKAISEAQYDKTIQATIVSCVDATIGKYKVKYQDSIFYAYSGGSDITYTDGANVYILVPGNDMSKDKTILGTTKKLGINYVVTTEGDEAYDVNGNNCISASGTFGLCSYREGTYVKVLYHKDYSESQNLIKIDQTAIEQYIKNSGSIICGGIVKTELKPEQQFRGNYGIIFALNFLDNTSNETVTRYYTVDVDKMTGNPYKLVYATRQYGIFDIDNVNFQQVEYISIFTTDFPNSKPEYECIDDIFISDIELCGALRLSDDDISNYSLSFITPQGTYFDNTSLSTDIRTLQAQVRVKGKVIDNESQPLPFYWFIEHVGITSQSLYYNKYGGRGWKCLNNYNIIQEASGDEPAIVEWIPASYQWTVQKSDIVAKEVKYKCVAIYDQTVISKTIVIKNLDSNYDITIESDSGEQFYFDTGFPTLTCLVNGTQHNNYTYSWGVTDNSGNFQTMAETPELNEAYNSTYNEYHELLDQIDREIVPEVTNRERLEQLKTALDNYETVTRVDGNKIYNLNVNTITNFSTYSCTVYYNNVYLGTASIILKNSLNAEGAYSLIINDGSYVYKYNPDGISPASSSLESPIEIKALTFSVFNNLGQKIDDDIIRHADIKWIIPTEDTLLKVPSGYQPSNVDLINNTATYSNLMSFSYLIEDRYDIRKQRNNIQLQVNYKEMNLTAVTDLTFTKEGESGTNGTEFACRIVPNTPSGVAVPMYPMITQLSSGSWSINYPLNGSNRFFRAQLYHNENKIFDSIQTGNSTEGKTATVVWSILRNKYTTNISDVTSLSVNAKTGVFTFSGYSSSSPAHIVKVAISYDGITYYATMPLITVRLSNNNYRVELKENTGFRYAIYTSDGRSPQYDNVNPFTLKVTQNMGLDQWEDITEKKTEPYILTYDWSYLGRIYDTTWRDSIFLGDVYGTSVEKYQKEAKPLDDFDGLCVTNAIECVIRRNGTEIARIHIPVHLLLNKYGNAALNGWDGNSVSIDEEGGFILAPQAGAGQKEADNSFTGVLMGKVKEAGKTNAEVGLFGYNWGERTFGLNSKNGSAIFGKNNGGQFIIDPTEDKALLYSHNFWSRYNDDGLPTSYYSTNEAHNGMIIDLTTPEIRWGNGNFSVNSLGYLTAKGGGSIAGWNIDDDSLFTKTKNDSTNVRISSVDFTRTINGVSRSGLRLALGQKFAVSGEGTMYAGDAIIGTGSNKITIGRSSNNTAHSAIYSGSKSSFNANASGFYIGTDGIALGYHNGSNSAFQVTSEGQLTARSGYIGNGTRGWTIADNAIYNGKTSYNGTANDGVYLGVTGIGLGKGLFWVNSAGTLHAESGTIGGWRLSEHSLSAGNITLKDEGSISGGDSDSKWSIDKNGKATFDNIVADTRGSIGGWTINKKSLTGGNITLNSEGSITGPNWNIAKNGTATFNNLVANTTGSIGGWKIGSNSLTGGSLSLNSNGSITGPNWNISTNGKATFNDIDVKGGQMSISGSNSFGVSSNGKLTATGADISGKITAKSGEIGGWKIGATTLKSSGGNVTLDAGSNKITITGTHNTTISNNGINTGYLEVSTLNFSTGGRLLSDGTYVYFEVNHRRGQLLTPGYLTDYAKTSDIPQSMSGTFSGSVSVNIQTGQGSCSGSVTVYA